MSRKKNKTKKLAVVQWLSAINLHSLCSRASSAANHMHLSNRFSQRQLVEEGMSFFFLQMCDLLDLVKRLFKEKKN